jgi:hypothetical protein
VTWAAPGPLLRRVESVASPRDLLVRVLDLHALAIRKKSPRRRT